MFAAGEVRTAGRGGLAVVSRITGLARSTINRGEDALDGEEPPKGQVRRGGAGRKTVAARDPGLVPALKRLLEPATLGDPMRPPLWVSKSMDKLAAILTAMGHPIGADTVRRELVKLGFSRQYNRKALRRYECGDPLTRHCGEAGHPFGERRLAPHQSRAAACSPLSSCNRFRLGRRPFRFRNANKILHRRFLRRALGRFNTVTSYAVAHGGDFARMRPRSGPPKGAQESPDMVVATITTKRVAEGAPTDFILASGFSRASPRSMASRIAGQTRTPDQAHRRLPPGNCCPSPRNAPMGRRKALAKRVDLDLFEGKTCPGFLLGDERSALIALARDGSATHRLARRAKCAPVARRWPELRASGAGSFAGR